MAGADRCHRPRPGARQQRRVSGWTDDYGYELQVLDSYDNKTYVNGQAASIYKQYPPLVNAMRKPGEWQTYDVIWTAPTFKADGSVATPAYVTAFHNGVLVQNHVALRGDTKYIGQPEYKAHGADVDSAAGARRSESADQLPQYLAARAGEAIEISPLGSEPGYFADLDGYMW